MLSVLTASAAAALYKVIFRRWHGDAPTSSVFTVLASIGLWSRTAGTPLLLWLDPGAFASAGVGRGGSDALASALASTPLLVWLCVCARALTDLAFNFFIAYGITLIHPLFIAIGTLLATPLNVLATFVLHQLVPAPAEWAGMLLVLGGFALLLADERRETDGPAGAGGDEQEAATNSSHKIPGDDEQGGGAAGPSDAQGRAREEPDCPPRSPRGASEEATAEVASAQPPQSN